MEACNKELEIKTIRGEPHYREINEKEQKVRKAFLEKIITKEEYEAMSPKDKKPGKFYELFKVHKEHTPPNLPPGRPVILG